MRRKIFSILFGLMFIAGFLILAYPTIANQWNTYRQGSGENGAPGLKRPVGGGSGL